MKVFSLLRPAGHEAGARVFRIGLAIVFVLLLPGTVAASPAGPNAGTTSSAGNGPFYGPEVMPRVVHLSDLPVASPSQPGQANPLPFHPVQDAATRSRLAAEAAKLPPDPTIQRVGTVAGSSGGATLNVLQNWEAVDESESFCNCLPPDGAVAAGPSNVLGAVNTAFKVFDKNGNLLSGPTSYDTFFGSCGDTGLSSSDPFAAYDPVAKRFITGILRYKQDASNNYQSYVSIAVSQTSDPTGTWYQYCFYQNSGLLYDFPHLAVWSNAIYTTGDIFNSAGTFQNARVNAYNKTAMYAGKSSTQVYYDVGNDAAGNLADHLDAAVGTNSLPKGAEYFVNADDCPSPTCNTISLWRWTDPFGTNQFVLAGGVQVNSYLNAVPMQSLGASVPLAVYIDYRNLDLTYYNNTLYGVHAVGCTPLATVVDCIQWYQLGNISGAPTLLQQGTFGNDAEYRAYPDLSVDKRGNLVLGYAYTCPTCYMGIRAVGRLAGDPPGTLRTANEVVIQAGSAVVTDPRRWGDYAGDVIDPDGCTHWHLEEYQGNDYWNTRTASLSFGSTACR